MEEKIRKRKRPKKFRNFGEFMEWTRKWIREEQEFAERLALRREVEAHFREERGKAEAK